MPISTWPGSKSISSRRVQGELARVHGPLYPSSPDSLTACMARCCRCPRNRWIKELDDWCRLPSGCSDRQCYGVFPTTAWVQLAATEHCTGAWLSAVSVISGRWSLQDTDHRLIDRSVGRKEGRGGRPGVQRAKVDVVDRPDWQTNIVSQASWVTVLLFRFVSR